MPVGLFICALSSDSALESFSDGAPRGVGPPAGAMRRPRRGYGVLTVVKKKAQLFLTVQQDLVEIVIY